MPTTINSREGKKQFQKKKNGWRKLRKRKKLHPRQKGHHLEL